ncbi:hypothetical protein HPG69_019818 [Diceros bicornis minor]|uniref:Uncharacterized protein n=1 Tax=Diceros bicornis minor TaxID=77932 RepID=A0A7J7EQD3_DICBM|nr:hypothetical protein HPG69_019818 [Diceros bicornis minor]
MKSLHQSFPRIWKRPASGKKWAPNANSKWHEANMQLAEQACPHAVEMTPAWLTIPSRASRAASTSPTPRHGPAMQHQLGLHICLHSRGSDGEKQPELREGEARQGKDVQLTHRAPLVAIPVLDAHAADLQDGHAVLIAAEERFKVFTLPQVSAKTKFKLKAHEGRCVCKVALVTFASEACENYAKTCLPCLTYPGDIHVFLVSGLRPQVHFSHIRKANISYIAACVFNTPQPGARNITEPLGSLDVSWPCNATHASYRLESPKLSQASGPWASSWPHEATVEALILSAARVLTPQSSPRWCFSPCPSTQPAVATPHWTLRGTSQWQM